MTPGIHSYTPNAVPKCDNATGSPDRPRPSNGKITSYCKSRLPEFTLFVNFFHLCSCLCTFEEEV